LTIKQRTIQHVSRFVVANKDVPREWRSELVRKLTEEITAEIIEAGGSHDRLWTWTMRHPALMKKEGAQLHTIADVLADFILNVDQVAERTAEYPIYNAEREYRDANARKQREVSLLLDEDRADDTGDWPQPTRIGTVSEDAFNEGNPVESALFDEPLGMAGETLSAELVRLKAKPTPFIRRYADGGPWNRANTGTRRTPENVLRAINNIELRRVKECIVCGNGFYSHSKQPGRQKVCDVMPHPQNTVLTFCQHVRDRLLAVKRKAKTKGTDVCVIEPFSNIQ
jgi:hypothetical protein